MKISELTHEDIEELTEEYLKNDGKITILPYIDDLNATEIREVRKEEIRRSKAVLYEKVIILNHEKRL